MSRFIYKVLINDDEVASFYELDYAIIFIQAMCEKYYEELCNGFNFTIKKVVENE